MTNGKPRKTIPTDYFKIGSGEYVCAGFQSVRFGKRWRVMSEAQQVGEHRTLTAAAQWCRAQRR